MYRVGEKRVLVVDDEAGVRSLLRNALEIVGYEVHTAADGAEALRLWESNPYGLVITDLVFMSAGGVDLVQRIRSSDDHVPILAITGFGQEVAQEALDAGADHVLRKPFHLFEVRDLVKRLIQ
jgi:DNA-binding response OmpR family regulator